MGYDVDKAEQDQTTPVAPPSTDSDVDAAPPAPPDPLDPQRLHEVNETRPSETMKIAGEKGFLSTANQVPPTNLGPGVRGQRDWEASDPDIAKGEAPSPDTANLPPGGVSAPGAGPKKQGMTFAQGLRLGIGQNYTTDAEGNVIPDTPAVAPTKKGIAAMILGGAMMGAMRGVAAQTPRDATGKGAALSAGAAAAMEGAEKEDNRRRAIAQQNLKNRLETQRALDEHHAQTATTAHIIQNTKFEAEKHPFYMEQLKLGNEHTALLMKQTQTKMNEDAMKFREEMAANGLFGLEFTDFGNDFKMQSPGMAGGATRSISNGKMGGGAGIVNYDRGQMSAPLTAPVAYMDYTGGRDKDGTPIGVPRTLPADGKVTGNDALNKYFESRAILYQWQQEMAHKSTMLGLKKSQADIQKTREEAFKDHMEGVKAKNEADSLSGENMDRFVAMLVDGFLDPSQMSKRANIYSSQLSAADKYSMDHYGTHFDPAERQRQYKYASDIGTQNTLKYLNSLTGGDNKGGNLKALLDLSNSINRTDFPALNNAQAWAKLETGDKKIAQYHAALIEVADQTAKILQGGNNGATTDAKLKQAQDLFNVGFNKDQMNGIASTLRTFLGNRKNEMIGNNIYLWKDYGKPTAPAQERVVPQGMFEVQDASGNSLGYAKSDGTGYIPWE